MSHFLFICYQHLLYRFYSHVYKSRKLCDCYIFLMVCIFYKYIKWMFLFKAINAFFFTFYISNVNVAVPIFFLSLTNLSVIPFYCLFFLHLFVRFCLL